MRILSPRCVDDCSAMMMLLDLAHSLAFKNAFREYQPKLAPIILSHHHVHMVCMHSFFIFWPLVALWLIRREIVFTNLIIIYMYHGILLNLLFNCI